MSAGFTEEEAELPLHLWEYEHTFLTDPTALLALDFQLPLPSDDAGVPHCPLSPAPQRRSALYCCYPLFVTHWTR